MWTCSLTKGSSRDDFASTEMLFQVSLARMGLNPKPSAGKGYTKCVSKRIFRRFSASGAVMPGSFTMVRPGHVPDAGSIASLPFG